MTNKVLLNRLKKRNACSAAIEWIGDRDLETAWKECPRGDWVLWLAGRANIDRKLLVKAACKCAELALPIYEKKYPKDNRVRNCIAVTLKWVAGKATIEEVREARKDACAAAAADADAYADTDTAAAAAADAYAAAYAAAAGEKMRKQCAAKVRRAIPFKEIEKALG